MPLIGRESLASMATVRDSQALNSRCQILAAVSSPNNAGGNQVAMVAISGGPFKCLVSQRREMPLNLPQGGVTASITDFKIKFAPELAGRIQAGWQVQMSTGELYSVIGVNDGQSGPTNGVRFQVICDVKLVI